MQRGSMPPFVFRLEQVLAYRQQLEEQAMLALALVRARLDARRRDEENCRASLLAQREKLSRADALPAEERWLVAGYIRGLEQDLERARRDIPVLEEECDHCRTILIEKAKDRKLLEKLKEKQARHHHTAETRKEQKYNDEIATLRYAAPSF